MSSFWSLPFPPSEKQASMVGGLQAPEYMTHSLLGKANVSGMYLFGKMSTRLLSLLTFELPYPRAPKTNMHKELFRYVGMCQDHSSFSIYLDFETRK